VTDREKVVRVNLSMTPSRLAKLDRIAASLDLTRSAALARLLDRVPDVEVAD
jgi:hypothetical protein